MGDLVRIGSEFLVNTTVAGKQFTPSVTSLKDGGFVVTWASGGPGASFNATSINAQIYDSTGAKVGVELTVSTFGKSEGDPAVTGLTGGGFVVTWAEFGHVKAQILNATGGKVGDEFLLGNLPNREQELPEVAALANGGFVLTWTTQDATKPDYHHVRSQIYDATGVKVGSEWSPSQETANSHVASLTSGRYVVADTEYTRTLLGSTSIQYHSHIVLHMFTATGREIGFGFSPDAYLDAGAGPIAGLAGGGFVIAWGTMLQLFDSGGGAVGRAFSSDAQPAQHGIVRAIGALPDGGFVVVWTDSAAKTGDTSFNSIHAQVFDASGSKLGNEFLVNTETLDSQESPSIAVLANGDFVISWQDNNETAGDGDPPSIKAQLFSPPSPPDITSNGGAATAALTVAENTLAVTKVTATDHDPSAVLTYTIAGGADAALFKIDGKTGSLAFVSAPDFDNPADAGQNNVYDVIVQASDGPFAAQQALAITVANINEAPVIISDGGGPKAALTVAENARAVTILGASDADAGTTIRYSIVGGDDAALFTVNAQTGELLFRVAPDFEEPADFDGNNVYDVVVRASDGLMRDFQAISVTVGDVIDEVLKGTSRADTLVGADGNDVLKGGGGDDTLIGNGGNDLLDGGKGADGMAGGDGDDSYLVEDLGDRIAEDQNAGIDSVRSSITIALGANIENLALLGTAAIAGSGNGLDNRIIGNVGANALSGGAGADSLRGNAGADVLSGGTGRDILSGGSGADVFLFDTAPSQFDSDRITDFNSIEHDTIRLSAAVFSGFGHTGALTAEEFYAADGAQAAQDASDRIIYDTLTGRLL